jgi:predicted metal-binding membrane protein
MATCMARTDEWDAVTPRRAADDASRVARPGRGTSRYPRPHVDAACARLVGVSAVIFVVSAAATVAWCTSMSAMPVMRMPGGWTMSMMWMRMPGQTWPGMAASFVAMWVVMMVAMMLPSLVPALWRYREAIDSTGETRVARLTMIVGVAYFLVWALLGMVLFPLGVALTSVEMRLPALSRAVPILTGVIVMLAGSLQFSAWKARHLACWRELPPRGDTPAPNTFRAWRYGVRLGLQCAYCCSNLMALLAVAGLMDLGVMGLVFVAITAERFARGGERIARVGGAVIGGAGLLLIARAAATLV